MNNLERINLQKMINDNNVEDNTNLIRNLKHSKLILKDVDTLLGLKKNYARLAKSNRTKETFEAMCLKQCSFLFNNYTDIYNKVLKDEIDLHILTKLLNVLHRIENEKLDQHEGSFEVGKLLKEIYIDSALRKANKQDEIDEKNDKKKKAKKLPEKKISWDEYKKLRNL